jgi:integrase
MGGARICELCLTSTEGPEARCNCACQKPLRRAIETELLAAAKALTVTLQEGRVEQYLSLHQRTNKVATATVADVLAAVEGVRDATGGWLQRPGPEIWKGKTWLAYRAALLRMARVVAPAKPETARLAEVLTRATVLRIQCEAQGVATPAELNLKARLDCNGGPNAVLRNAKGMFSTAACQKLFAHLALPDLREFRELPPLPSPVTGFVPWEPEVWAQFVRRSEALREKNPTLWAVNAWLRRTGVRDDELLRARRSWIEVRGDQPALVIKDRGAANSILKQGKARRIGICAELWALVKDLPAEAYLVADGLPKTVRYDLIYRDHCAFVAQFIPDRQKRNHELRMMAGSIVYEREGLEAAADFLGDGLETTRKYYATALKASAPLSAEVVDWSA